MPFDAAIQTAQGNAQRAISGATQQAGSPGEKPSGEQSGGEQAQGEKAGGESATIKLLLEAPGMDGGRSVLRKKKLLTPY